MKVSIEEKTSGTLPIELLLADRKNGLTDHGVAKQEELRPF